MRVHIAYAVLDLPLEAGESGYMMILRGDSTEPDPLAPPYSAWLADFVDRLERGEFAYSEVDGCIMYADDIEPD
jgi:hypothetical protein